jgi:diacylglycerol kinase family enzyme
MSAEYVSHEKLEHMPLEPPDQLLIIANPASANAIRGKRLITDLLQAHPGATVDVYPTSPDGREVNQQRLLDLLQERTDPNDPDAKNLWIVLATGDGTIRDVAEALQYADDAIRNLPVLPLAAGNGNDFTSMAHSLVGKYAPGTIMKRAHLQPVYPLRCTVEYDSQEPERRIGLGYITFGATAHAAEKIDKNMSRGEDARSKNILHKLHHIAREKSLATRSILTTNMFEIEENGTRRQMFDRIFANGNRMAKHFRLPGKLEHNTFHDIQINTDTFWATALNAGKLACGLMKGEEIEGGKEVTFTTRSHTMMQLDGEAFELQPDARITVTTAEYPLNIVRLV